jgi:hypothetical protein
MCFSGKPFKTGSKLCNSLWLGTKGGGERCVLCGLPEDIDHLIFKCSMAKFVWSFLGEALGWHGYPRRMDDLISNWLPGGFNVGYQNGLACFARVAWQSG